MIIIDANILLYAYDSSSPSHDRCRSWLAGALNGPEQIGLPWQSVLAFIRISTNSRVFRVPLSASKGCEIVTAWLAQSPVLLGEPGPRFWSILQEQIVGSQATGPLVTDAALASLAIEHGARLCTTDRDFTRFRGLRLIDPTA